MNKILRLLLPLVGLCVIYASFLLYQRNETFAARTQNLWVDYGSGYVRPTAPSGSDILVYGSNRYLNFGAVSGSAGNGLRDNSGVMEYQSSGAGWIPIGSGGSGGGGDSLWATTTGSYLIYPKDTNDVVVIGGNATTTSGNILEVIGNTKLVNASTSVVSATTFYGSLVGAVSSDAAWTSHNSYPTACSGGQVVSAIGDTLTCVATSTNANTATALASNPSDCAAGTAATAIDASGNLTCSITPLVSGGTLTSSNVCQYDGSGIDCNLTQDGSGDCAASAVCTGGHTHAGVNETYGSGWNADTDTPEKDDVYDYLHLLDTDDDGSANNLDTDAVDNIAEIAAALKDGSGACSSGLICLGDHTHVGADETYGSGWASDTSTPEKDDVYDYMHLLDTDDDGAANNLDTDAVDAITEIAAALKDGSGDCSSGLICLGDHTHSGYLAASSTNLTLSGTLWTLNAAGTGSFTWGTNFTINTIGQASTTALTVSGNSYLGTISSGTWNGATIGAQYGGTGSTTLSGILKGNGTNAVQTAVPGTDYESSSNKELLICTSIDSATATDDNIGMVVAHRGMTIKSLMCNCTGTCTTAADFALKDNGGNRMTHGSSTCSTTGNATPVAVTANNSIVMGESLLAEIVNSPTVGGYYTVCASSTIP